MLEKDGILSSLLFEIEQKVIPYPKRGYPPSNSNNYRLRLPKGL